MPPQTISFLTNNGSKADGRCAPSLGDHRHEDCKRITNIEERKQLIRKFSGCLSVLIRAIWPVIVKVRVCVRIVREIITYPCERKPPQT